MKILNYLLLFFVLTSLSNAQWEQSNGPWEGNARCFINVGTSIFSGTSEGIFVSTDNGRNWKKGSMVGLTNGSVRCFLKSGTDLFAGTDGGVFLSTNNGTNWFAVNTGLSTPAVNSLLTFNSNIYATTNYGVYATSDNGASWYYTGYNIPASNVSSLIVSGNLMFVGTNQGVFKSTDLGSSWASANFGLISQNVNTLFLDGTTIYAGTSAASGAESIYKSTNNGTSWFSSGLPNASVNCFIIYNSNLYAGTSAGIFRSPDNGANWSTEIGNTGKHINSFFFNGYELIAGTLTDGILLSASAGNIWNSVGYKSLNVWSMDAKGNDIWITAAQHLIYHSSNSGDSWISRITDLDPAYRYVDIAYTGTTLYSAFINNNLSLTGLFESTNNGMNWDRTIIFTNRTINCVKAASDSLIYLAFYWESGKYGLNRYKGPGGYDWNLYNEGVWDVAFKDSNIFATPFYNGVKRTRNNGLNWVDLGQNGYNLAVEGNNVYTSREGLFFSTNDGDIWQPIGLTGKYISKFAVYQNNIIAGVNGEGIYVSSDNGQNWSLKNDGLSAIPNNIADIIINKGVVFIAIDDIGVMKRSIRSLVNVKENSIETPSSYSLKQNYPNPFNPSTTISFSIPQKSFITLKVYDLLGKETAVLSSGEFEAGTHTLQWNAQDLASGIYIYTMNASAVNGNNNFTSSGKMVLLR